MPGLVRPQTERIYCTRIGEFTNCIRSKTWGFWYCEGCGRIVAKVVTT